MNLCHAVSDDHTATTLAVEAPEVTKRASRACPICGRPMKGRQSSACSSACRTARSRNAKRDELLTRVRAAYAALQAATDAVRALEAIAENATVVSMIGVTDDR